MKEITCIFGAGSCARQVAENLLSAGSDIIVVASSDNGGFPSHSAGEAAGGNDPEVLTRIKNQRI